MAGISPHLKQVSFTCLLQGTVIFARFFLKLPHLASPFSFPLGTVGSGGQGLSSSDFHFSETFLTRFDLLFLSEPLGFRPNGFFFSILFVTHVNILNSDRRLLSLCISTNRFRLEILPTSFTLYRTFYYLLNPLGSRITASASYLVSCISGANPLLLYVVTRFFTDGCFQAHRQVVFGISLPFALSMKFETLSIDLGCFPLNVQYLSTAVGLRLFSFKFIHSLHLIGTL